METIIGVQALKNSKEWSLSDIELALSAEALTSAVMQRYHVNVAIKQELGSELGRLQHTELDTVCVAAIRLDDSARPSSHEETRSFGSGFHGVAE